MQSIEQARRENEESYIAIRTNVNGEVVLRLRDYDEKVYFARRFFGDYFDFKSIKHIDAQTMAIPRSVPHTTYTQSRAVGLAQSTTTLPGGETTSTQSSSPDVDVTGEGWHIEYDYERLQKPTFYTPDELERMAARRFGTRPEGQAQRFGIVKMNDERPDEIEIPKLPPPRFTREAMVDHLRTVKARQAATLSVPEATARFDALISKTLNSLVDDADPTLHTTKRRTRPKAGSKGDDPTGPGDPRALPRNPFR
jgi:hypothetical protein